MEKTEVNVRKRQSNAISTMFFMQPSDYFSSSAMGADFTVLLKTSFRIINPPLRQPCPPMGAGAQVMPAYYLYGILRQKNGFIKRN